eukprot:4934270-Amphidinium_carterae.1
MKHEHDESNHKCIRLISSFAIFTKLLASCKKSTPSTSTYGTRLLNCGHIDIITLTSSALRVCSMGKYVEKQVMMTNSQQYHHTTCSGT